MVAPARRPRKPGLGNITGRRKPPLQRPVRPGDGPGGRERQKPVGPGRPTNPGGRERRKPIVGGQPSKPGGAVGRGWATSGQRKTPSKATGKAGQFKGALKAGKPGSTLGKVAKPRRLKKRVIYN